MEEYGNLALVPAKVKHKGRLKSVINSLWNNEEYCQHCGRKKLRGPNKGVDPMTIPLSQYHVRCKHCLWPVATRIISESGLCRQCNGTLEE